MYLDRRCSNYISVINKFIAYKAASKIRGLTTDLVHVNIFLELDHNPGATLHQAWWMYVFMHFVKNIAMA